MGRLCCHLLLVLCLLPACTLQSVTPPPLPPGFSVRDVAPLAPESPLAVSRDGSRIALADRTGLHLRIVANGNGTTLSAERPTALVFSPQGDRLLAAFDRGADSELIVFTLAAATPADHTRFPGRARGLFWNENGILVLSEQLKVYKFGSNLQNFLHHWDGDGTTPLRSEKIHDVTLDPVTLKVWGGAISRLSPPRLSPWGDEILLPRLIDPPAFDPYLKLVIRHLISGAEREVATGLPLDAGDAAYLADGDEILHWGETGALRVAPWSGETRRHLSSPGRTIAASADGDLLWLDGKIFRNGDNILQLPPLARPVAWLTDGQLFFRWQERLWLLRGLPPAQPPLPVDPQQRERLLHLRNWRAQGLISPQDYLEQTKERPQ